jgi:hypothetical protein
MKAISLNRNWKGIRSRITFIDWKDAVWDREFQVFSSSKMILEFSTFDGIFPLILKI